MMGAVDWNEVGALAGIAGVLLAIVVGVARMAWRRLLEEINQNKHAVEQVVRQVTPTPRPVRDGTLASAVVRIETKLDDHSAKDERRFGAVFPELGIEDPENRT